MEFGLLQPQNTSERVWNAFGQGRQMGQEMATQSAMSALAGNPDDPKAMQRLLEVNPEMGMRFQQQQRERTQKALEANRDNIVKGAQIFRQFGVKDEATYQQARNAAQQMGIDVSQVPPNYDPAYVNGVVQIANTFEPQKQNEAPSAVREYEYRQSLPADQQAGYDRFRTLTAPRIFGSGESGYNVYDPSGTGGAPQGGMPTVATPQDAMSLPPGTQFRMPDGRIGTVPGGAGGNASGGFPDPLAPR